uniref:G-protein coupled receptors family 2 profile 2 domain-containing protein n=1 Tax=Anopheles melas TaxID=34690 RepID=A0A182TPG1_9DIPT
MIDAGGRVGDGQDGQIQFDRLEFESPEDLMRHLYYTCMRSNTSEPPWTTDGSTVFCPRRFDGWSCWEPTLAGTVAENWCPKFVLGFDPRRLAYRTTLKCTRIRIHIHLFTSLALSCLFWIVWYKFVVEDPDVLNANTGWCVGLHILLHYLMLVNYFWMFCEGLHLHLVLVIVFIKDIVAMRWFVTIGWILPMVLVSLYALVRNTQPLDTEQ